ncbi:hypothetical protein AAFF_G00385770 [Aldrovandia affinis]|uniref:Uncharacterized protein n=1 Tax=Aldrovandia affinis TaxID=143900 RepID=A0AAD7SH49_9TELE|nr:hypothetical protein AAFF_G00385770 [Aldrovandia affinis]
MLADAAGFINHSAGSAVSSAGSSRGDPRSEDVGYGGACCGELSLHHFGSTSRWESSGQSTLYLYGFISLLAERWFPLRDLGHRDKSTVFYSGQLWPELCEQAAHLDSPVLSF